MDVQTLSNLFATTFNPDPNIRKRAELDIRKVGGQEGVIAALLHIIGTDSIDIATRQACSVYLKNRVQKAYVPDNPNIPTPPDRTPIAQSDRDALKGAIFPLIVASPTRSVSIQLSATLKTLVAEDFPEKWPGLFDVVLSLLDSSNVREITAGCTAVLEIVRVYRFRQESEHLYEIISRFFPKLVLIASNLLSTPPSGPSQDIPTILHLILKTYKHSIVLHLSPHQQTPDSLVPWGRLLFQVVNLNVPKEGVPDGEEEREKCEWWKTKKWAYGVLGRLFHRYGNPSQLPSPLKKDYLPFAEHFVSQFAPEIFKIYLHQVELLVSGQAWLSQKCQYLIFQFFTECVKPKSTWTLLRPHFETLVSSMVFPQLSFNHIKQELWDADPVDYVRLSIDEYEDFAAPVSAATTFLMTLAKNRTKTTFMPILGFINSVLESNAAPPQKFGALTMTHALGAYIMRHSQVRPNIEQFIVRHVFPEFQSSHAYMRAVACDVIGTVEKNGMEWSNDENLATASRAVANALNDPELPVRVQAALALTELVTSHKSVEDAVRAEVGKVIQDLLKLSDETDLDVLNSCMETMVERYYNELLPVASQLTARLCESYLRLMRESMAHDSVDADGLDLAMAMDDSDEDVKTFAAMGIAKTIGTIISAVDSSPEILGQVEQIVIPIIQFTFENKLLDLFDNMYDLVDSLTFSLRRISPNMWPIFELTYKLFKSDAIDFIEEMLPSLDNFISYGADVIKGNPDYKMMILDMYTTTLSSDQLGENDRTNGCKLIESYLLNLRGEVNEALPSIIQTAISHLEKTETRTFKLANLEVLINAVLYNPSAALHLMETTQANSSRVFFDMWFAAIKADDGLPRVHDKKLSIMALCALLELDASMIPAPLQEGWSGIVAAILHVFKDLPKAIEARKVLQDALEGGGDDDDESEPEGDLNDVDDDDADDKDVWDEESEYIEMLAQEGARLREQPAAGKAGGDDESESSEDDESIDEELGYISPLESVDVYVTFKQALTVFQMKNGPGYQAATASLGVEQQTMVMELMALAEKGEAASA
ncbi:ARM repeat-containing protein [Rickenella mellea]|uniref:ARM repeat-containing protein n=1 Tax=Rickenella mellea TaxID=50990 RepID=A0A4Y7PQU7_9AGAM|nr:ARM repeat-containing protein [Rickenella mellea]